MVKVSLRLSESDLAQYQKVATAEKQHLAEVIRQHLLLPKVSYVATPKGVPICPEHKTRMGKTVAGDWVCLQQSCFNKVTFEERPTLEIVASKS